MVDYLTHKHIQLRFARKTLNGTVRLTGSKSESNRALLLRALSKGAVQVQNLSDADDTRLMEESLAAADRGAQLDTEQPIDVGPAGTVMRFMAAYLAISPSGRYRLSGSRRMHERPIGLLVDALRQLGADITYTDRAGYPPLSISGGFEQQTNRITIPGNVSSQYVSALLLIAPALPQGLRLQIDGVLTSQPYVTMTLDMLSAAGIQNTWEGDTIEIQPQAFAPSQLSVEPDWSAASYWYSLLALAESGTLLLSGLRKNSLQGDRMIATMMEPFGIRSTFRTDGVLLEKKSDSTGGPSIFNPTNPLDFTACPDIAQSVIICAAALRKDLSVTGLHTLRIKETDRIAALQQEIGKFGVQLIEDGSFFHLRTGGFNNSTQPVFDTYEDHRMAMAFAPLALVFDGIQINDPGVVKKSYPDFWVHLQSMGASVEPLNP